MHPVPAQLDALPAIDAVIISHDHYDHLDVDTIRSLARTQRCSFYVPLGVGAHLRNWGIPPERVVELDWNEEGRIGDLSIVCTPARHFSGRFLTRNTTLWSSMVVRTQRHAVCFSGDTGLTTEYERIRERLGPFDLVMLEVGAYHPSWGDMHLGPENALKAYTLLGGGAFLPVHWGTFSLAMHAWDQPAETLLSLGAKFSAQLVMPRLGEPVEPAEAREVAPWWRLVDNPRAAIKPTAITRLPEAMPWPID